jgi:hypothetical protein
VTVGIWKSLKTGCFAIVGLFFKTGLKKPQVRRAQAVNHQVIRGFSIFSNKSSSSADVGRYIVIAGTATL